ncbi:MAG: CPBP family glutamic-type intramembrane protease, partial [Candidatus Margulisiibacteriota bacterium]
GKFSIWWLSLFNYIMDAVNKELIFRLFFLSMTVWLFTYVFNKKDDGSISDVCIWFSIIVASFMVAALPLPAIAKNETLTPLLVGKILVVGGGTSIIFGWLYWKKGLLSSITAHLTANIILFFLAACIK